MKIPQLRRRRRRPAITAITAMSVAAGLVLSGCAGTGGPANDEATSGVGDVPTDTSATVRVLMENVPDTDIVQGLVGQFNEKYPDIKVDIETMTFDQMRDRLVSSFQAAQPAYDLIVVDNPWMDDFADAGFLQPLDERIAATTDFRPDDFFPSLTDITDVDGTTYGVPFYNYALGYIYNKDDLAAAGASVPTDLDALVRTSQQLKTADRAGIAMQPQRGYKIFEEWANWLFAAGGSIYDKDGNPTLDTEQAARALDAYIETYRTAAPANSLAWGFDEAFRSVSSGKAASMVGYNWNLPALNDPAGASGERAGQFALAPIPGGKSALGLWSWAIPANSAASDAAWAFISWITSPEIDAERVAKGGAVVRESSLTNEKVLKDGYGEDYYRVVGEILSDAAPLTQGKGGEEMIQAVGTELNDAAAGNKSVADALRDAQAAVERIQK
ncbi:ABC transporter substrate-binding protein [Mycolicibacterium smegmatis]|jgi:ABC-type glycerol-3-phosphate transport system substrate-binding protein|uniref:Extracellular solute-binding protein, family protein 1 n=2 Tax=Mycolicibacterium smegmatis (strain ATCC 700084 / mc(2)155) TaxID=246196 RepID=A0QWY8_MYCS2|nr:sugar ABC transporter substrate-binding protein [Mycolicibacterium smegmatis]ABK71755.1 extracellular solute-binding protein, family protein 1 [Mycolicibacterium smegmatis MC2 155]AFP39496.1 Extracellular solute-binding protein [Mycolicibacterium smegmatis MC2 155]AIU08265.1 ABC transporter substrate-binding protein [Mycolicibacterium smegmatis MC2 155]AIU14890.1 ABC transporter substrate-binding protein [Mycolicibacterium smegmatis]AIU21513.1 ABC transporter substrate-binding protein [Myco